MAVVVPSPLISEVHGNVGGLNFYKNRGFQCIRRKSGGRKRHTPNQAVFTGLIRKIHHYYYEREAVDGLHYWEPGQIGSVRTKYGINYEISLYNYFFQFMINSNVFFGWNAFPLDNEYGSPPNFDLTMELQDCPNYARLVLSRATVLNEQVYFWWDYPWHKRTSRAKGFYPFKQGIPAPTAGPVALTGPRITGRSEIHYKWRFFSRQTGLSRINKGIARKDNWQ